MSEPEDPSLPSKTVDNRGATIAQQVIVQGNATFGVTSDGEAVHRRTEIIDFAAERGRHTCFFGREDVLAEMDAWIEARDSGWLLVTGGPGLGKSALLDRWARRREEAGQPIAVHFIRRGHKDWADPSKLRANLAAQVEVMFPEQRNPDADPAYRLEQLLERVSPVLAKRDDQLVLLVDGLDEAMTLGKDNPIPDIFPLEVPARVFVVTASRPQYPHLGWFDRRNGPSSRIDLDAHTESNEKAVREYWSVLGKAMEPPLSDALRRAAVEGAQGNLLHAVKLHQLWSAAGSERSVNAVPRGLAGMLDELWRRIEELPKEPRKLARQGLSLICAARESLPLRVVEKLLGWDEGDAQADFLPLVREMLLKDPWQNEPAYRPFHERLREFVEEQLVETVDEHRMMLVEYASWPVNVYDGNEHQQRYALRHRIVHLVETGRWEDAAATCMDVDFLTTKACAEGVHAVERDIQRTAQAQVDNEIRRRLTTLERVVAASSHWATEAPDALPALLYDRALTNAPALHSALIWPINPPPGLGRLRHPLQIRGMPRLILGHRGSVNTVAMLSHGRIVSGSGDNTLRVWAVDTGRPLVTLRGHQASVKAVAVLPDGRVVSGSADRTLRLWNVDTGRILATLQGHQGSVNAVVVLPDGRIVSGSDDETLKVWNAESTTPIATIEVRLGRITALATLPCDRIVTGSGNGTLRVWDMNSGRPLVSLPGHAHVKALVGLPDGRIVSGFEDGKVCVWDTETKRVITTFEGHKHQVGALAVSPEGHIISSSDDRTVRIWNVQTGQAIATLQGHESFVWALAALPDGRIVSGSFDQTLRIWDVENERTLTAQRDNRGHQDAVSALAILHDGRIISGSEDETLKIWSVESGHATTTLQGHRRAIRALTVLADDRVVSVSADNTGRVWDIQTGRTLVTLQSHQGSANALVALRDDRIVSGSSDKTLCMWDTQTGRPLAFLQGHQGWVSALAVLPDGHIVSGSWDTTLRLWDVETKQNTATIQGHRNPVLALAVLPDGRIVSGSFDKMLRVWNLRTGSLDATFQIHQGQVKALAVLSNGSIVSGSSDKTLRVWDVETGRILATVYGDASFVSVACVSDHIIVAGDAAGNVWFVDLP